MSQHDRPRKQRERKRICHCCGAEFVCGYSVAVMVSSLGHLPRQQKLQLGVEICEKCGNAPGSRTTRPRLQVGLRVATGKAIAHIASSKIVLTLSN